MLESVCFVNITYTQGTPKKIFKFIFMHVCFSFNIVIFIFSAYSEDYYGDVDLKALKKLGF